MDVVLSTNEHAAGTNDTKRTWKFHGIDMPASSWGGGGRSSSSPLTGLPMTSTDEAGALLLMPAGTAGGVRGLRLGNLRNASALSFFDAVERVVWRVPAPSTEEGESRDGVE